MKHLLIILLLLLPALTFGQMVKTGVVTAQPVATSSYPAILDDGDTDAWFIAEAAYITENPAGYVQTWADVMNNYDITQGTEANRPSFASGYIQFDGTNDALANNSVVIAQPLCIYWVIQEVSRTDNDYIIQLNASPGYMYKQDNGTTNRWRTDGDASITKNDTNTGFKILRLVANGASSSIQVNADAATTGSAGTGTTSQIALGFGQSNIRVKEIIFRSVLDDATEQTSIVNYLNTKYTVY